MSEPGDLYHLPATQQIRDPTQTAPRPATRQIRYTLERGERWVSELPTVRVKASLLSLKCVGARVQSSKIYLSSGNSNIFFSLLVCNATTKLADLSVAREFLLCRLLVVLNSKRNSKRSRSSQYTDTPILVVILLQLKPQRRISHYITILKILYTCAFRLSSGAGRLGSDGGGGECRHDA